MYYLVYGFFYLFSLLPMWVLYGISDFACWLLFSVFGYRKNVINSNLAIAFPEKTKKERDGIASKFQKNFTDTFIETIKLFSASREFLMKRIKGEFEVLNALYDKGLRCQVHMGHNFNWEMGNLGYAFYCKYPLLGVYMPLKNKALDRIFKKIRSRFGTILIPATDMRKSMFPYRNSQYLLGLIADQVPGDIERAWWLNFFGMPSPFISGPEKGARAGNIPVVFINITQTKRGHYYLHVQLATETPADLPEGEITRRYRDFLEKVIREHPEMWLWSHRRWKKPWKPDYHARWIDIQPAPEKTINPYETISV
ncbi:lysophospholipid acyltransferase family protein [Flavihumibacter profundi]|uniref:lysophospholipid acyltransferase family protein n=1 Tax=Flavihumibacter profundi TaxID=2716883 RepID=UPI001CC7F7F1|nr:lysophospholipid acyltransferase family protein [Flavihumibacter profundi]MBZ5857940.1 lysophospholipid acyltransferase family protein [Flavihumibacter profundi]